jgi:hypothetical protein
VDKLFEGIEDEGTEGVSNTYAELLDCGYGRCWSVMAKSVDFLFTLRIVCLELFPSLI